MSFTEYEGGEGEDFAFDLNDISSFLYSIGYLNKQKFHNIQKNKNSLKNFEIFFEENQNITVTDTSVKYGTLLTDFSIQNLLLKSIFNNIGLTQNQA